MSFYSYQRQAEDYRNAAWDQGCTCPLLPPHVHLDDCPLSAKTWEPRDRAEYLAFLEEEHRQDEEGRRAL